MSKSNVNIMGYIGRTPGTAQRDSDSWYTPKKYLESGNTRGQCFVFFGKSVNTFAEKFKKYELVTVNYFDHFTR